MTDTSTSTAWRLVRRGHDRPCSHRIDPCTCGQSDRVISLVDALAAERDALAAQLHDCRFKAFQDGCGFQMQLEEIAELRAENARLRTMLEAPDCATDADELLTVATDDKAEARAARDRLKGG